MDNKNEKTFADLFSSSTPENNSKDVNLEELKEEQVKLDDSSSLTFDSLFDQAEKEEQESFEDTKEHSVGLNSLFEQSTREIVEQQEDLKQESKDIFSMNDVLKQEVVEKESDDKLSFSEAVSMENDNSDADNRLFSDEKETKSVIFGNVSLNKDEIRNEETKEVGLESASVQTDFLKNLNPVLEEKSVDLEEKNEVTEFLSEQSINPLFESTDEVVSDDKIEASVEKEIEVSNPLFGINPGSNDSKTEDKDISVESVNPLFESTDVVLSNENVEQEAEEKVVSSNPFFEENASSDHSLDVDSASGASIFEEKEIETVNPFLDANSSNEILNEVKEEKALDSNQSEKAEDFWEKPQFPKEEVVAPVEEKSISPFFQSEEVKEENPLFIDKINLVENVQSSKQVSNIDVSSVKHYDVAVVKKKEPLLKFILGVVSYAIFILLLLIGVTLLVYVLDIKIRAAKGDTSSPKFNAYVVLTGSMLPEIQVYDVVVTKKVEASELEEGDVITFASADTRFLNTIITHRIIKKNYDSKTNTYNFQTRGDNNNVADSALVPQDNIYGKVILKIPKLGYLQEFLASDGGWIIVILIPCLTVISYDVVKLAKGLKNRKNNNIKVQK